MRPVLISVTSNHHPSFNQHDYFNVITLKHMLVK